MVVVANDCIWYDGVLREIARCVAAGIKCYSIQPLYKREVGEYQYPCGEGKYTIYEKDGYLCVRNEPKDNDMVGGYNHRNLPYFEPGCMIFNV